MGFPYLLLLGGTNIADTKPKVKGIYVRTHTHTHTHTHTQNVLRQCKSLFLHRERQQIQGRLMGGEFFGASVLRPTTTPLEEQEVPPNSKPREVAFQGCHVPMALLV